MRLSEKARAALHLLAVSDIETLNAYGLSQLRGYEYADTQPCLRVLRELALKGFVIAPDSDGHRAWGPECDHYRLDIEKIRTFVALDSIVAPPLSALSLKGPRERLSVLAA